MKTPLFLSLCAAVLLSACSSFQKPFTFCSAGYDHTCFDADDIRLDKENGCVFSDDSMICGPFTLKQNYRTVAPMMPTVQAPEPTPAPVLPQPAPVQ